MHRAAAVLAVWIVSLLPLPGGAALVIATESPGGLPLAGAPGGTVEVQLVIDSGAVEVTSAVDVLLLTTPPGFTLLGTAPGALLAPDVGTDLGAPCPEPTGCWSILSTPGFLNALRVPLDEAPPVLLTAGVLLTWTFAIAPDIQPGEYALTYQVWFDNATNACGAFDTECVAQIQVVPEPEALALLLAGLALLGVTGARRRLSAG